MEHVVFYPSADGSPAFRRVASLDEATRFVEHLRNVEDVTEFSVYQLTHVPPAFRAYYRVEVPGDQAAAVEAPAVETPAVEAAAVEAPAQDAPVERAEPQPDAEEVAPAAAEVPAPAEPADVPATAEVPAPAEPVEPAAANAGAGDGRKSLSFFAR